MKNYAHVATKIRETPWLITPESLSVILSIVEERIKGHRLSDEAIEVRLTDARLSNDGRTEITGGGEVHNGVGIIPILGPIFGKANLFTELSGATSLESFRNEFRAMLSNDAVHTVLLQIDSPGGTSEMVNEVADEIYAARDTKPVYAIADSMSASAAYYLGSQAEKMYATPSGEVGSIGVYTVHEDQSGKDAQQGRKFTYVAAGPYKTEGNPHEPLSQEGRAYRQEIVNEIYDEFVTAVGRGRNVSTEEVVANYGGGRVLSAKKALDTGMIDGIQSFESLVGTLATQPRRVQVVSGDKAAFALLGKDGIARMESKEWEHSDAGVSEPPPPRQDQDGSDDLAIKSGSRRDPLPLDPFVDPGAPKPSSIGNGKEEDVDDATRNQLCQLLGLSATNSDEELLKAASSQIGELNSLKSAVGLSAEEMKLKTEFPHVWEEHQNMREASRLSNAKEFVDSVKMFKKPGNDGQFADTKAGLSTLAKSTLASVHAKFAVGQGTLSDFENAIKAITHGGVVEFGELGSEQKPEDPKAIDTRSAEGIHDARKMFAAKIAEVQTKDSLTWEAALKIAAEQNPELAAAYRSAAPA